MEHSSPGPKATDRALHQTRGGSGLPGGEVTSDLVPEGDAGRMFTTPKPYPKEFRDGVVRVALNREPGVRIKDTASDLGYRVLCRELARPGRP